MFTKWSTESLYKNRKAFVCFFGIVFLLMLALAGCALLPEEEQEEVLPPIQPPNISQKPEYTVTTKTLVSTVRGIGKIMSRQEEQLFFTLEGEQRLKELYVKTGDVVEEGQLLAELDVTSLENEYRSKKLQLREDELEMIKILRRAADMDPQELEQAKIDFELKRQELVELEEKIAGAKIYAPFSGTVVALYYQKGDSVQAYEPVILLADLTQLVAAAKLNETDLEKVAAGMEAIVDINAVGQFQGTIAKLPVNDGQENSNDYYGRYPFDERQNQESIDDYMLISLDPFPENVTRGTPLSVQIIHDRRENAVVIPLSALRTHRGRNYVQVVDEKGTKREVDVELGLKTATEVEIVKGLEPGQKVVGR